MKAYIGLYFYNIDCIAFELVSRDKDSLSLKMTQNESWKDYKKFIIEVDIPLGIDIPVLQGDIISK
jgi:hypothetical protein